MYNEELKHALEEIRASLEQGDVQTALANRAALE